jgi:NADH-quinone oxidoreductase subunit A
MPVEYSPYLFIVLLLIAAVVFALAPLGLAWLWAKKFSPRKPGPVKNAIYECGLESKGDAWVQFKAEYYLYAIIFLIFDVETIFVLPFAVAFGGLSVLGMAERGADVEMRQANGVLECWSNGVMQGIQPHHSNTPTLHFSIPLWTKDCAAS